MPSCSYTVNKRRVNNLSSIPSPKHVNSDLSVLCAAVMFHLVLLFDPLHQRVMQKSLKYIHQRVLIHSQNLHCNSTHLLQPKTTIDEVIICTNTQYTPRRTQFTILNSTSTKYTRKCPAYRKGGLI